jgi:hypothetical protein
MSEQSAVNLTPRHLNWTPVDVPGYTPSPIEIDGHLPHLNAQIPIQVTRPDGTVATETPGLPDGYDLNT